MKCPECDSVRFVEISVGQTMLGWSPRSGQPHIHDPNSYSALFSCENGHRFGIDYQKGCPEPDCPWPEREPQEWGLSPFNIWTKEAV